MNNNMKNVASKNSIGLEIYDPSVTYHVSVTNGNTKLGKGIPAISLPVGLTCNPEAPCFKYCYATRGKMAFKPVKNCYRRNLFAYQQNPKLYFKEVAAKTTLFLMVRWNAAGDIPDVGYLKGMVWVAKQNPKTLYLAFTKQYKIVNEYMNHAHNLPKNLRIVFSTWQDWVPENPYNFPTTWVRFPENTKKNREMYAACNAMIPKNAFQCTGSCPDCGQCWKAKKGEAIVFKKH